jgi:hypothetical protein
MTDLESGHHATKFSAPVIVNDSYGDLACFRRGTRLLSRESIESVCAERCGQYCAGELFARGFGFHSSQS